MLEAAHKRHAPPARPSKLNVFDYEDFRVFLADFHSFQKRVRRGWTLRVWARELGLKSPSSLVMILKGERNPSESLAEAMVRVLSLDEPSRERFLSLVELEKRKRSGLVEAMLRTRLEKQDRNFRVRQLTVDQFAALSSWHVYAIRELARLKGFQGDPVWIAQRLHFSVSPHEARSALSLMLRLGLLRRNAAGGIEVVDENIVWSPAVASRAVREFHAQSLENIKKSLQDVPFEKRELRGACFPIATSRLEEARQRLRGLLDQFCDEFETVEGDEVYQLELALFPLTTRGGKSE